MMIIDQMLFDEGIKGYGSKISGVYDGVYANGAEIRDMLREDWLLAAHDRVLDEGQA
jgi:hypothetical protein